MQIDERLDTEIQGFLFRLKEQGMDVQITYCLDAAGNIISFTFKIIGFTA